MCSSASCPTVAFASSVQCHGCSAWWPWRAADPARDDQQRPEALKESVRSYEALERGTGNGKVKSVSRTEKVTVSLPAELLVRIEQRRHDRVTSRSEVVSELLWLGWHQAEAEEREARYRAAYQAQPETSSEHTWADEAARDLLDMDDSGWSDAGQATGAAS